jgi:GNAT superfamily N-acetyltransferase
MIREAKNEDAQQIYEVHIASIRHFCSAFYPENSISGWIASKTIESYKKLPEDSILIVAEINERIAGFGLLNLGQKSINSLYVAPINSGTGIGKMLLINLEKIAQNHGIFELKCCSTLNAVGFYRKMGYEGNTKDIFKLRSGITLDCIGMKKILLYH